MKTVQFVSLVFERNIKDFRNFISGSKLYNCVFVNDHVITTMQLQKWLNSWIISKRQK